jgi:hypothetical protein
MTVMVSYIIVSQSKYEPLTKPYCVKGNKQSNFTEFGISLSQITQ